MYPVVGDPLDMDMDMAIIVDEILPHYSKEVGMTWLRQLRAEESQLMIKNGPGLCRPDSGLMMLNGKADKCSRCK